MYPQGYFHQRITEDGWQEEIYQQLNFADSPISSRVVNAQRQPIKVRVELDSRVVYVAVWQVNMGQSKAIFVGYPPGGKLLPLTGSFPPAFTVATVKCVSSRRWSWALVAYVFSVN